MSAYEKTLTKIQSTYQFSDGEISRMDYTIRVFFYEASKILIFIGFFSFFNKLDEYVVCLLSLLPFRWLSGGLHLKNYWSCLLFSFLFFAAITNLLIYVNLAKNFQFLILLVCNIAMYWIGPVTSNKRRPTTRQRYNFMRRLSSVLLLTYTILYFTLENIPHRNIVFWSIVLQVIQLFCAKLVRKGDIYEKEH